MTPALDVAYGGHAAQRYDLHLPAGAPRGVLAFVHGGGWAHGDRRECLGQKLAHWLPRGWAVAVVDYRLLPAAPPVAQAGDVAAALDAIGRRVGAPPVAIGHSTGAHLVALALGTAWLTGAALLDSGALDVPALMRGPHLPLHDRAFGIDAAAWRAVSPLHRLRTAPPPLLLACSSLRPGAVAQNAAFAARARALGGRVAEAALPLPHAAFHRALGLGGEPTATVDGWLDGLPKIAPSPGVP